MDVDFESRKVTIKELFLSYVELHAKDVESIERVIMEKPEAGNPTSC